MVLPDNIRSAVASIDASDCEQLEARSKFPSSPGPSGEYYGNRTLFDRGVQLRPTWPVILAEGDSWFDYQHVDQDIIWHLNGRTYGCAVRCEATAGDKMLEDIHPFVDKTFRLIDRQRQYYSEERKFAYVLLSAGGNDLLESDALRALVDNEDPARSPAQLVRQADLTTKLTQLQDAYQDTINAALAKDPDLRILAHGYDYPIPNGKPLVVYGLNTQKAWIKPVMDEKGIAMPRSRGVVAEILDQFNTMLGDLAAANDAFVHVDLRGSLTHEDSWSDEIHPEGEDARLLAGKIKFVLNYLGTL